MPLPIKHPLFNLREICKQCLLLEDHLNCSGKRCSDCIRKHFLMIEGLFEEATSLDTTRQWDKLIDGRADLVRKLESQWLDGVDPRTIAGVLRAIRKGLSSECFDLRPMGKTAGVLAQHIAEAYLLRMSRVAWGNPVKALRTFLAGLHKEVLAGADIYTPENQKVLAKLMAAADEALVGHPYPGRPPFMDYAKRLLALDTVAMHLGDGGYSRITVTVMDPPHLWGHSFNSDIVNRNWQNLKG